LTRDITGIRIMKISQYNMLHGDISAQADKAVWYGWSYL